MSKVEIDSVFKTIYLGVCLSHVLIGTVLALTFATLKVNVNPKVFV